MSNPAATFDPSLPTRIIFGVGCLSRLGECAREVGARHVLLVTDPGLVAAGHAGKAADLLRAAGLGVTVFDRARENPTSKCVETCRDAARDAGIDAIVGLGGGSAMDTAKGCNFLLTNGGKMEDYKGRGKATKPMLAFIAVPTTAGTGSECQSYALIADEKTHLKMACGDAKAAARIALLDPCLTLSQPPGVTARTGTDAVAHALETAVTKARNGASISYSHRSFQLTHTALPRVLANPADLSARADMLLGAAYAGCAIEASMLGAAHAAANPLTARYNVVHGQAVGMMLPAVVRFNSADPAARAAYRELAAYAGLVDPSITPASSTEPVERLLARLDLLLDRAGIVRKLSACGVPEADIPQLAAEAAAQWTAGFNPRPISAADFEGLYRSIL